MKSLSSKFDFSEYTKDHLFLSETNKKSFRKIQNELNGEAAHQFVGLKSKMYSNNSSRDEKKKIQEDIHESGQKKKNKTETS